MLRKEHHKFSPILLLDEQANRGFNNFSPDLKISRFTTVIHLFDPS